MAPILRDVLNPLSSATRLQASFEYQAIELTRLRRRDHLPARVNAGPWTGFDSCRIMTPRQQIVASVAARIAGMRLAHPVRVAIDGVDAAGKTVFADELAETVRQLGRPIIRASIDGFHNPQAIRRRRGSLSPEGYFEDSFNYPALIEALLQPLGPGGSGSFRRVVFVFRTDEPVTAVFEDALPGSVLLFDGVFLLRDELRAHFDFSVFLRATFEVTIERAERRDVHLFGSVEEIRRRYRQRYIPGQELYLRTAQPERWASVIVDNNDPMKPRIEGAV